MNGHQIALSFIKDILQVIFIATVDKSVIREAINSGLKDFEDAVQVAAAKAFNSDGIITRNKKDFTKSGLKIFTSSEFISKFKQ
ncbi:MAG: hypothetical protein IPO92_09720 [Saprospiraceae bacterium]|nr:hypothetical protein [Saprospiraceae bacterium]